MAAIASLPLASPARSADLERPVLLELFTSQSCSSCPPADALLGELAGQPDVLALSFHIDYWNDLGWVDRLSAPAFTARQQAYAQRHGFEVYTPQLVVDGRSDVVGSDRAAVGAAIAGALRQEQGAPASIRRANGAAAISIGTLEGGAEGEVYLISFDPSRSADIRGGENGGSRLVYTNVVRSLRRIGHWRNQQFTHVEPLRADETGTRLALIVQDADDRVWAAASN
jgi:hypothetical protein